MKFNKIKLIAGLCLALGVSAFGQNNVGTLVTDPVRPFSVSSTHPSAIANEIKGGPFSSSNLAGLSNIPAPRLELGAIGYATNTGLYYRLTATNPATWSSINGANITNIAASNVVGSLTTNGNGAGLTNLTAANITGTVALASNVTGTVAVTNGGTGATNAGGARTNLGLGSISSNSFAITNSAIYTLTNFVVTNGVAFFGGGGSYFATFESTNTGFSSFIGGVGYFHKGTNIWYVDTNGLKFTAPAVVRSNLDLSLAALTNTNASNFRTAIGATAIGHSLFTATNSAAAIDAIGLSTNFSDQVLSVSNIFIGAFPSGSGRGFVVPTSGRTLQVVGTNVDTAIPAFFGWNGFISTAFSAAEARTNLGLNAWTTNTNSPVFVGTNGEVVSPTNFWQVAPISTTVQYQTNVTGTSTNAATNSRNLFLFSLAPSVSGVTNTVTLPTNAVTTFEGDRATIIHLATNSANAVTAIRQLGAATNLITLNQVDEAVLLMYRGGQWGLADNLSFIEPIYFSGTNAAANAAASRTNLGLGANATVNFTTLNSGGVVSGSVIAGSTNDSLELISEETNSFFLYYRNNNVIASTLTFAPTQFIFDKPINFNNTTNAATTRANLGLGTTNSVSFVSIALGDTYIDGNVVAWDGNNRIQIEERKLLGGDWEVDGGAFNIVGETNKAITRTNLGLGATNNVTFSNVTASGTLTATSTVTAKTNLVVEGFVDFTTNRAATNGPTNAGNFNTHAVWITIKAGTNTYFLPAYQ